MINSAFKSLIVAVSKYKFWKDLPIAQSLAEELANGLDVSGHFVVRRDLLKGGDHSSLSRSLNEWLAQTADDDRLFLYWTGHGYLESELLLVAKNSPRNDLTGLNSIAASALGHAIAQSRAEKILVIVDTCFSGRGAIDIASAFAETMAMKADIPGRERAIAVIASAPPLARIREGAFARALQQVLFTGPPNRLWSDETRFIRTDQLSEALALQLTQEQVVPKYKADGFGQEFMPNPRFRRGLVAEDVETRGEREARERLGAHFELASRGIEVGETGWYFTGRTHVLSRLVKWLKESTSGIRILTGPPGSGKSAVLGRLAMLSDGHYRALVRRNDRAGYNPLNIFPPLGSIDVAIHAKGKTLDDCARALAAGLKIAVEFQLDLTVSIDSLILATKRLKRRITVLIDALDEATPEDVLQIVEKLIVPLTRLPQVRALIGTRRSLVGSTLSENTRHKELRETFGQSVVIDDLSDENATTENITEYVQLRLVTQSSHSADAIASAALRVAENAGESFLYARIVSRTLQELPTLDGPLPADSLKAFAEDIDIRFPDNADRVHCLLSALAWGLGSGLTRSVWPKFAGAIAANDMKFTDEDISWVLSNAGWHIIETGEGGQAVYRLIHQAFSEYYRDRAKGDGFDTVKANKLITSALTSDYSGATWLDADRYSWRYLAVHAAKGEQLKDLIVDPGFLAVSDPITLLPYLQEFSSNENNQIALLYDRVAHLLPEITPLERMAYIHLIACIEVPSLSHKMEPPLAGLWRCRWARMQPTTPHRVVGRHRGSVNSIALGQIDGQPVIIAGSDDKTIGLWSPRTGQFVRPPLMGHDGEVSAVTFQHISGIPTIVSSSLDGTVRLWDANNGKQQLNLRQTRKVNSLALGVIDDRAVIVMGNDDGFLHASSAIDGSVVLYPFKAHLRAVTALAIGSMDNRSVIASASRAGNVKLWDFHSGEKLQDWVGNHASAVNALALGSTDTGPIVVAGGDDNTIQLWSMGSVPVHCGNIQNHRGPIRSLAVKKINEKTVIVSTSDDKTVGVWDSITTKALFPRLEGHEEGVTSVVLEKIDNQDVMITSSRDGTLRRWNLNAAQFTRRSQHNSSEAISALSLGYIDGGKPVIVSGGFDGTLRLWNADQGTERLSPIKGHSARVSSVAFGAINSEPIIVSAGIDGNVRVWNARTGKRLQHWSHLVYAVETGQIEGKSVIISAADESRSIYIWDASNGTEFFPPIKVNEFSNVVTLGFINRQPVIAAGGPSKRIQLWDARTGKAFCAPFKGLSGSVSAVAFAKLNGRPVVIGGDLDGTVNVWDTQSQKRLLPPLISNNERILAVALTAINGREVVVAGSREGVIHVWDVANGAELHTVKIERLSTEMHIDSDGRIAVATVRGLALVELSGAQHSNPRAYQAVES